MRRKPQVGQLVNAAVRTPVSVARERASERASLVAPRTRPSVEEQLARELADAARTLRLGAPRVKQPQLYCPFPSAINPHVDAVQERSVAWAVEFGLVAEGRPAEKLAAAKIAHLEALVMHHASREALELAADWTTWFCLLDDQLERDGLGPVQMSGYFARLLAGFEEGTMNAGGPLADALSDIRQRLQKLGGTRFVARFASVLEQLFLAFVWEEINRKKRLTPTRHAYGTMRADTVGLAPQFLLGQLAEGIELSDGLRAHAQIEELEQLVSRAVGWANDVCTYEKELMAGEPHNLVFVLMASEGLSLESALREAAHTHDREVATFIAKCDELPNFGADEQAAQRYVGLLRRWIRGHLDWSALTGRYQERPADQP